MAWNDEWVRQAACLQGGDPDALFVPGAAQHNAKVVCRACPVRTECLAEALDNRQEWGVWGGMTERERRAVLRRRPTVTSWRKLLEAERDSFDRQRTAAGRPAAARSAAARSAGRPAAAGTSAARSAAASAATVLNGAVLNGAANVAVTTAAAVDPAVAQVAS